MKDKILFLDFGSGCKLHSLFSKKYHYFLFSFYRKIVKNGIKTAHKWANQVNLLLVIYFIIIIINNK